MRSILVVDDEKSLREFLSEVLEKDGFEVFVADNGLSALTHIENEDIDLALVDLKMPGMDGMELLEEIKAKFSHISVIMMTAYGSEKTAVDAMKRGASNYLKKPFESIDELKLVIKKEFESQRIKKENILLKQHLEKKYPFHNIVGISEKIRSVFEIMTKVKNLDSTILITGESGTGKELVASSIHYTSHIRDKPFITVSCGALPENLLESELFGHTKGAFTGAVTHKVGLLELAQEGTFFLDEIGEASPSIQVKLLRVLQNKTFMRVGGTKPITVNVRIIAATNKNLEEAVTSGHFREDLFYRLNVIPIHIPPLRERPEDIRPLIDHFIKMYCQKHSIPLKSMDEDVYDHLLSFHWPGNVRQLENVIERMLALESSNTLSFQSLPQSIKHFHQAQNSLVPEFHEGGVDLENIIEHIEKKYLIEAMQFSKGMKKNAAKLLNISFRSLRYRLQKYAIDDDEGDLQ
ncbi:sigma-54-dependent Fis family transcriptional regulator [bacterium]|nr:sigma-54-dependent Fis family transcriptional regulator [bacterium]